MQKRPKCISAQRPPPRRGERRAGRAAPHQGRCPQTQTAQQTPTLAARQPAVTPPTGRCCGAGASPPVNSHAHQRFFAPSYASARNKSGSAQRRARSAAIPCRTSGRRGNVVDHVGPARRATVTRGVCLFYLRTHGCRARGSRDPRGYFRDSCMTPCGRHRHLRFIALNPYGSPGARVYDIRTTNLDSEPATSAIFRRAVTGCSPMSDSTTGLVPEAWDVPAAGGRQKQMRRRRSRRIPSYQRCCQRGLVYIPSSIWRWLISCVRASCSDHSCCAVYSRHNSRRCQRPWRVPDSHTGLDLLMASRSTPIFAKGFKRARRWYG